MWDAINILQGQLKKDGTLKNGLRRTDHYNKKRPQNEIGLSRTPGSGEMLLAGDVRADQNHLDSVVICCC